MMDRRAVIGGGLAAMGLMAASPAWAQKRRSGSASPLFTHGVASGEPGPNSMLFWTRYQGTGNKAVPLRLEVATQASMNGARVVAEAFADPARDWTARATVTGLKPATTYYYRWIGPAKNDHSMVGRTRTLPDTTLGQFRMGVFAGSAHPYGWFNAYAHAVAADDIDLVLHLGDYLMADAPPARPLSGRSAESAREAVQRADYWARFRHYRSDPDLQALHANFPGVFLLDAGDVAHRFAKWDNGRAAAAIAARRDWLPISDAPWARYDLGRLATLYRLDAVSVGRDAPLDVPAAIKKGPDVRTALKRVQHDEWVDGSRQMLGYDQEKWLYAEMKARAAQGVRWQILAQQPVMGRVLAPAGISTFLGPNPDPYLASWMGAAEVAAPFGLPINMTAWDGYPAARARLLAQGLRAGGDLVVLSGNSNNSWANDLQIEGRAVGVEFAAPSVTMPGLEVAFSRKSPAEVAEAMMRANPTLRWADTARRGYMQVEVTPAEVRSQWRFTSPVTQRSPQLAGQTQARVMAGQRRIVLG